MDVKYGKLPRGMGIKYVFEFEDLPLGCKLYGKAIARMKIMRTFLLPPFSIQISNTQPGGIPLITVPIG